MPVRPLSSLSRDELEEIAANARDGLFKHEGDWDLELEVHGADYVDLMIATMNQFGLVPTEPFDHEIVTIEVRNGVVTDVRGLPPGYCYALDDTDNDGAGYEPLADMFGDVLFQACVDEGADPAAAAAWPDSKRREFLKEKGYT